MLTIPTPDVIRDVPADAVGARHGRTPGAVGVILRGEVIAEWVHSTLTEHECDAPCSTVHAEDMLLLRSPIGEVAVIGAEGVGDAVDETADSVPVFVAIAWSYEKVDVPHQVIQRAMTTEGADVAGFIRLFGDRLDNNAYIWRRFCGVA